MITGFRTKTAQIQDDGNGLSCVNSAYKLRYSNTYSGTWWDFDIADFLPKYYRNAMRHKRICDLI